MKNSELQAAKPDSSSYVYGKIVIFNRKCRQLKKLAVFLHLSNTFLKLFDKSWSILGKMFVKSFEG